MKKVVVLLLAVVACLGVVNCGGGNDGPPPPPTPTPASDRVTADIFDGRHPNINVYAGTVIRFRNLGEIAHTVTAKDGSFDSGPIEEGRISSDLVLHTPGVYEFYDTLNPGMEGRIQVFAR